MKQVPHASSYKCHKCKFISDNVQVMEYHFFQFHDLKDIVRICKLHGAHFTRGANLQHHVSDKHACKTTETGEFPSSYIETWVFSFRFIPFCTNGNYANFYLFKRQLGCFCESKRPVARKPEDFKRIKATIPPLAPLVLQTPLSPIPPNYVLQTVLLRLLRSTKSLCSQICSFTASPIRKCHRCCAVQDHVVTGESFSIKFS